jgi:hypothetical protein
MRRMRHSAWVEQATRRHCHQIKCPRDGTPHDGGGCIRTGHTLALKRSNQHAYSPGLQAVMALQTGRLAAAQD